MSALGIVVIGRNEGERLRVCLQSTLGLEVPVIYVDSNSSDGSLCLAKEMGVQVVALDPAKPCSAARARRIGCRELAANHPELQFVFFVDGDCEIVADFPKTAVEFLEARAEIAVVGGRRRERFPGRSAFNRFCDYEWNTPPGETIALGGDAVYRLSAYLAAGEFNPEVPAGEEPELCYRIRQAGWRLWRIDQEMTTHDAAMTRWREWWTRQVRTGYGGYLVERRFKIGLFDRLLRGAIGWTLLAIVGVLAPPAAIALSLDLGAASVVSLAAGALWVTQIARIAHRAARRGVVTLRPALEIGALTMLAKPPIVLGMVRALRATWRGDRARIIEYKRVEAPQ
jgi:cellulose synthase/poly-beta-1,6-N-acetylglucosamine synthase-like glycosyltransferase